MITAHRYFVRGDIDMANAPQLRSDLDALVANQTIEVLVLDCGGMTFIDSSGLHIFLAVQRLLEDQGRRLRVENLSAPLRHFFDIIGLSGVLRVDR